MEHIAITKLGGPGTGFHIEGYPDAVKVVALSGPRASRVAALVLHLNDLTFAEECLQTLARGQVEPVRRSLWQSALVSYLKCFGSSAARFQLDKLKIHGSNQLAIESFDYFKAMRDKHVVHDENAYLQGRPGAIINRPGAPTKIAKIVTFAARVDILEQDTFTNLQLLIEQAKAWVIGEHDSLCDILTTELEGKAHEDLVALPELQYSKPTTGDASKKRQP